MDTVSGKQAVKPSCKMPASLDGENASGAVTRERVGLNTENAPPARTVDHYGVAASGGSEMAAVAPSTDRTRAECSPGRKLGNRGAVRNDKTPRQCIVLGEVRLRAVASSKSCFLKPVRVNANDFQLTVKPHNFLAKSDVGNLKMGRSLFVFVDVVN